jgi:glycosyltransferase involved in cell wall biosynthesis
MNSSPLVSILMTAYNREQYIIEAIESVLYNHYTNIELIIVDDGSKDETVNIARRFEKIDNRIKVFINSQNLGDYPNRNKAASLAKGEFIMYVDSDDKLLPDTITNIFKDSNGGLSLNFAMYWQHSDKRFQLAGNDALKMHFFDKQFLYMGPGGTFIRKSFFDSVGGYPEKYGPANDMYFNLKACSFSEIYLFPYEFIYYRIHDGQEINNHFNYLYNNYNYMRDALNDLPLPFTEKQLNWLKKKNKRRFVVNLFNYFVKTKNINKTIEAYKKASFSLLNIVQGLLNFN